MAKVFMRLIGVVLTLVGVLGFFFPLTGFMDLTVTHNLIHLITGIFALAVSNNEKSSIALSKMFGFVYLLIAIAGLFVHNLFGLIMLDPNDTVIHFILAALALYIGFKGTRIATEKDMTS